MPERHLACGWYRGHDRQPGRRPVPADRTAARSSVAASAPSRVITMSSAACTPPGDGDATADDPRQLHGHPAVRTCQARPSHPQRDVGRPLPRLGHPVPLDAPRLGRHTGRRCIAASILEDHGPLLRTPNQGADTLVWLAADDAALNRTACSGSTAGHAQSTNWRLRSGPTPPTVANTSGNGSKPRPVCSH